MCTHPAASARKYVQAGRGIWPRSLPSQHLLAHEWLQQAGQGLAGKGQAGGSAEPAGVAGCSQVVHPGAPAPSPHMGQHTHLVEVLLIVAAQQKEEVGTGLLQQRVPAQPGERPPQQAVRSAEQELQKQRARLMSCNFPSCRPRPAAGRPAGVLVSRPTTWAVGACAAQGGPTGLKPASPLLSCLAETCTAHCRR